MDVPVARAWRGSREAPVVVRAATAPCKMDENERVPRFATWSPAGRRFAARQPTRRSRVKRGPMAPGVHEAERNADTARVTAFRDASVVPRALENPAMRLSRFGHHVAGMTTTAFIAVNLPACSSARDEATAPAVA